MRQLIAVHGDSLPAIRIDSAGPDEYLTRDSRDRRLERKMAEIEDTANIDPYIEHGKKREKVKKITVSIPLHVLKLLTDERTRRQVNNLRHATNSELLCEAFLHAYTGQPVPTDDELRKMIK